MTATQQRALLDASEDAGFWLPNCRSANTIKALRDRGLVEHRTVRGFSAFVLTEAGIKARAGLLGF